MRVPSFYCPNCGRFKRQYQVERNQYWIRICKHCGTAVYSTNTVFSKMIIDYIKQQEKTFEP